MKNYTVLGLFEDTGLISRIIVTAEDEHQAMRKLAKRARYSANLAIIGAIEGAHTLYTPGDDNRQAAYACDLADDEFTCEGCGREESECSAAPCAAVIADREG